MGASEVVASIITKLNLDGLLPREYRRRVAVERAQDEVAGEFVKAAATKALEAARRGDLQLSRDGSPLILEWATREGRIADAAAEAGEIMQAAFTASLEDAVRKFENVRGAVSVTEESLDQGAAGESSKTPPDDWLFRWRDYAGEVSSEDMQSLWGKILAGEISAPSSFSLRTLDFVRNLSEEEAKIIAALAPFVHSNILFRQADYLASVGFPFAKLLDLQDLGVISGVEAMGLHYTMVFDKAERQILLNLGTEIITVTTAEPKSVQVPMYKVTRLGRELLRLGKVGTDQGWDPLESTCRHASLSIL